MIFLYIIKYYEYGIVLNVIFKSNIKCKMHYSAIMFTDNNHYKVENICIRSVLV